MLKISLEILREIYPKIDITVVISVSYQVPCYILFVFVGVYFPGYEK